jgi:hypothetical protein
VLVCGQGYSCCHGPQPRFAPGGLAYLVMSRTWGGVNLFENDADYQIFQLVLVKAAVGRARSRKRHDT